MNSYAAEQLTATPTPARKTGHLRQWLPRGGMLTTEAWRQRHRRILEVLWLQAAALGVAALLKGNTLAHSTFEMTLVAFFAATATLSQFNRRASTLLTSVGLLTGCAVLVHLFNGRIEMHFSYFVMVGVVTLYQDWLPLLVSIGYVVLQHGIGGAINPAAVYDHPSAIAHPWQWAAVHGGFILAMSAVGIVSWRMNEAFQIRLSERESRLREAQVVARIGSWQADVTTGAIEWSDEFARLLLLDAEPRHADSIDPVLRHVIADDRPAVEAALRAAVATASPFECDFRVRGHDGELRWLHGRGEVTRRVDGRASASGTVQDVTARKKAEAGLAETLSQLSATLDSTADGILAVSTTGMVTTFNEQFADMFELGDLRAPIQRDALMSIVLPRVKDPEPFLRRLEATVQNPKV
ncbi:MAG TPA: PAS domain-containing protein, partial [Ilumatobacteraceae bacterium]